MRGLLLWTAGFISLLIGHEAWSQHQVYDPLPPAGSAYIRFVNALDTELTVRLDAVPGQHLGVGLDQRVTAYFVVERVAGRNLPLDAQAGSRSGHLGVQAEPGSYVTMVLRRARGGDVEAIPIVDHSEFNQARARLSFYNATTDCVSAALALDPDGPAVFQDVNPGTVKTRSVNPVNARLSASCAGLPPASLALDGLEPGGVYSIWLMAPDGRSTAFLTRDTTAPWRP
jgi:hypothetical protein